MKRPAIYLRPFDLGDETRFTPRVDFARELRVLGWDWRAPPGPTWTIVRSPGQVIGFGGGARGVGQDEGVYQGYAFLADVPRGDWPMLLGCARAAIDQLERVHHARRLNVLVREDFDAAARVLERLGFTRSTDVTSWPGYRVMQRSAAAHRRKAA